LKISLSLFELKKDPSCAGTLARHSYFVSIFDPYFALNVLFPASKIILSAAGAHQFIFLSKKD
jgi:hypothetical protein